MGGVRSPAPVQPIVAMLGASPAVLGEAREVLETAIAPIALASAVREWVHSDYYRREMGPALWRQYATLDALMAPEDLADLKRLTNALEERWRGVSGRAVNLDAGYLDLLRVVLASTKDAAHRVAIGTGLYAEAALHFAAGRFQPWPYTYPDYAASDAIEFFTRARAQWRAERVLKAHTWDGRARWRRGSTPAG
jgi:hypothetical protein